MTTGDYSCESDSRKYAAPKQATQAKVSFSFSRMPGERKIAKYQAATVLRKNPAASFKNKTLCLFFICYLSIANAEYNRIHFVAKSSDTVSLARSLDNGATCALVATARVVATRP
jgi:hypothetical protein